MAFLIKRSETKRRRQRRAKLGNLRKKYAAARTEAEKNTVLAKVIRVAPWLSAEQFLAPISAK